MALRELALDDTGDLRISGGELGIVDGAQAIAQRIQTRFETIRGEWVFDVTVGTPWLPSIVGAKPRLGLIRTLLQKRLAETDGVASIQSLDLELDRQLRILDVSAVVVADTGESVEITTGVTI